MRYSVQVGGSAFAQQTDGRMHTGAHHRFGFAKHAATHLVGECTLSPETIIVGGDSNKLRVHLGGHFIGAENRTLFAAVVDEASDLASQVLAMDDHVDKAVL